MALTKERVDSLIAKKINVETELSLAGVAVTATAAELNAAGSVGATTSSAAELNFNDGSLAGTAVASKTAVLGTNKNLDVLAVADLKLGAGAGTSIVPTAAQINLLAQGAAAGYMLARSAAPVALDASNPTPVAHGLTTCVAAFVQLVGSAAPGDNTSVLTCVINGANIDVYAWKNTSGTDPTLVASTGTETFNWIAIGT
jgi:hypothetical protein